MDRTLVLSYLSDSNLGSSSSYTMFNWFRRNDKAKQTKPDATPPETPPEVITESTDESETEVAEPDYLVYAKAAYQNIQQRKEEAQTVEPETEVTKELEEDREIAAETESIEASETDVVEAVNQEAEATEEIEEKLETPTANVPAWMQKSQGLDKLKETAIETAKEEIVEEVELDEDFVWSSKVLAGSGRAASDVSEEEISWLTKLRQGLGKTRIGLVNQLKSIVGKGPLNDDAVMEIESLLLQADVGIEATDYIIETLQTKLKSEALPPDQAIAYLKTILQDILDKPLEGKEDKAFVPEKGEFNIWLMTGVNGAGKNYYRW